LKRGLTIYASPDDRALLVSKILFRSRYRVGQLQPEDISPRAQQYFHSVGRLYLISYLGKRTDIFGHSYFTTNPAVSSDLTQMIRSQGRGRIFLFGPIIVYVSNEGLYRAQAEWRSIMDLCRLLWLA